ncbi:site-specific DNA-methyltransferase [Cyanobacteria bacterium FACHB-471]|nr:site-specific DNA-methyltransferase [Cyanobacteria bacterium FACHB-471]
MVIAPLQRNFSLDQERLELLKQIVPEVFADGKINWETLKESLGEYPEEDEPGVEHFGLSWAGKREARKVASLPTRGTLIPVPGKGIDEKTTRNIFIEGDNLEVLKLLQKSYAGRIKMIYIDPPYNTGNDFIYNDSFSESIDTYLSRTGQTDDSGKLLTSNPKAGGRFHSNWLSMMYPRLKLARNLLQDDGLIIISISDHEVAHLKLLLNEIFGEECFLAQLVWKSRQFPDSRATSHISTDHEYILVYSKDSDCSFRGVQRDESKFSNPDNDPRGPWMSRSLLGLATVEKRPNLHYEMIDPVTGASYMPPANTGWRYSKERMHQLIRQGYILFPKKADGRPREKKFRSDLANEFISFPTIIDNIFTAQGTAEIRDLFGFEAFDFPKPAVLIKALIEQTTGKEDLILDFFAGSGTTAQAVMELNLQDGGSRKYICVQLPEDQSISKEAIKRGYENISDLSRERIREVAIRIKKKSKENLDFHNSQQDLGFRVYNLHRSNFKAWSNHLGQNFEEIQASFLDFEDSLVNGWKEQDVIVEILLHEGFPLDSGMNYQNHFPKNKVLVVESTSVAHQLFICLDESIADETTQQLQQLEHDDVFICLDIALTDQAKMRLSDVCNIKTI